MIQYVERMDYFPTPVWKFNYEGFDDVKQQYIDYLTRNDLYLAPYERNGVQVTEGDLHMPGRHDPLVPLRDFMLGCVEQAMDKMGYEKDCGITNMWATRQRAGGMHHEHIHKNAFLVAVFYLFDIDGNATGTTFKSPLLTMQQLQPRIKKGSRELLSHIEVAPFVPGTCLVFPSWALHGTLPSPSRYRIMVGINTMPIGKTNGDHYNQYEFPDPKDMQYLTLDEHKKIGYGQ